MFIRTRTMQKASTGNQFKFLADFLSFYCRTLCFKLFQMIKCVFYGNIFGSCLIFNQKFIFRIFFLFFFYFCSNSQKYLEQVIKYGNKLKHIQMRNGYCWLHEIAFILGLFSVKWIVFLSLNESEIVHKKNDAINIFSSAIETKQQQHKIKIMNIEYCFRDYYFKIVFIGM